MATTNNKLINGSGLSELSSQIKSYVDNKSEIAVGATAPTNADIKIWVDTSIADTPATSISWENIRNKPTIPSIEGLASETYVDEKIATIKVPSLDGYVKTTDLSAVATSGSYNDLKDKPTIPSTTGLASTKYVDNKVAGIVIPTVPTKVSAFENDKGYLTSHQSLTDYAKKTEIPTVPTNISAFTNDTGYLTQHQSLAEYSTTTQIQTMISSAINAITNGNEVSY